MKMAMAAATPCWATLGASPRANWALLIICLTALGTTISPCQAFLKGLDFPCDKPNGEEIEIPNYLKTATVRIRCECQDGVGQCQKINDKCLDDLKGCHFVTSVTSSNSNVTKCDKVCRPCHTSADGILRNSGTTWSDENCHMSQCFSGVVTSSRLQCPTPMCPDPVLPNPAEESVTQCCPSCRGCSRAGQLFSEGESKPDYLDPCNECTCRKGHLECVKRACPVLPCARNLHKTVKGQCCPICARQAIPGAVPANRRNKCQFRNREYFPGQRIAIDDDQCTTCICSAGGTNTNHPPGGVVECNRKICPDLKCPYRFRYHRRGDCCPKCMAEPGYKIPAVTCRHDGNIYQKGDAWTSKCDECTCGPKGRVTCTPQKCPDLRQCPPGYKLKKGNKCCDTCELEDGVCTVFGDPHYKTFDGQIFNFQGSCKYLLAQDCGGSGDTIPHRSRSARGGNNNNNNSTFSIRITNDARDSLAFSWTRTITIRLYNVPKQDNSKMETEDLKVSLLQGMRVKINGKRVTLPYIRMGVLSAMKDGYKIVLRTADGLKLLWDGVSFLEMTVPPKYRGQLCGLCGNFNGDKKDDFYGKQHAQFTDGQRFGDSWRVGGLRACSILPQDMPHSYQPGCTQSWESRIKSDKFCNALHTDLFSSCPKNVDTEFYYKACRTDMCECPGEQCHCEVLTAYARECERASGKFMPDWREDTNCRNVTSFKYTHHRRGRINRRPLPQPPPTLPGKPNDVLNKSPPNLMHKTPLLSTTTTTKAIITTTTTTTTRTTTVVTTSTTTTELPDWIKKPNRLGPILPGCNRNTAKYCNSNRQSHQRRRPKLSKAEKRKRRRKQRRKRKRKQRRLRQKMLRQWTKQNRMLRTKMGLRIEDNPKDNQGGTRRLQWTLGGKPPFETLLSSSSNNDPPPPPKVPSERTPGTTTINNQTLFEENYNNNYADFDPHAYKKRISSSDFLTPRKGRQRTPLPLKEAKEDQRGWKRRKRK